MNHSTYLMREQVRNLVPTIALNTHRQKRLQQKERLHSFLEVSAFILALLGYIIALSLIA